MLSNIKNRVRAHLINYKGWSTKRKIVVFESDDWGSIRMPNKQAFDNLLNKGVPVNKSPYCLYDNLCSVEDIELLFNVLRKHKDSLGKNPVITANVVVANPDFKKIKETDFGNYYYESVDKTLEHFFPGNSPLAIWKEGLKNDLFFPQFHGREHVNVPLWLKTLRANDPIFTEAFNNGCWGISTDAYNKYPKSIQASFDYNNSDELQFLEQSIDEGLDLFEKLFGYKSESFIPNNYIWSSELDYILQKKGVKYMQGMKYQLYPKLEGDDKRKKTRRYNGQRFGHNLELLNIVRNGVFEPSFLLNSDRTISVRNCLEQIQNSFFWSKPAVISVHRINFCGTLQKDNRDTNLILFDKLLKEITKKWPDVIFMDTVSLAELINK